VTCWGENRNGQLGQPLTSTTLPSPSGALNLPAASSISLGARHACALLRNGGVRCWGDDSANQLGTAENLELWEPSPPFQLPGGIAAQQVEAGNKHTCARSTSTPTPTLACWGNNSHGQLGNGSLDSVDSPTLTSPLPTGTAAIGLAAGESFTCARITGSAVTCWGSDQYGKLGNGSSTSNVLSPPPAVTLPAPGTASRLATGDDHACVVLTDGNVSCWGDDYYGQLGNGAAAGSVAAPPAGFSIGGVASAITAGSGHTCAAQTNGDVRCWGDDAFGQLGDGVAASDLTSPSTPLALPAPGDANRVAAGRYHTCALLTDGKITCWGSNSRGQLGRTGASQYVPPSPIVLPGPGTAVDVDTGSYHSCALLTDSTVACWGTSSAAGIDTVNFFESAPTLVALPAPGTATAISTGDDHTCAVLTDGKITCWGSDLYGERGDGEGTAGLLVEPTQSLLFPGQSVTPSLSMVAQSPIRLLETRSGAGFVTVDGQFQGGGLRPAGSTLTLTVGGRAGISATTSAVSLNIAVTGATDSGYVTVYPCDSSLPLASSINFRAGVTIANASFSDLSATGTVCLFVSAPTHLIVDLNGTFPQLTGFRSVTPARLLETRSGVAYTTIDGQFLGGGPRTAQSTLQLDVRGRGGVPASAHSVTLNVTAVNPSARGFITAYPCDAPQPTASSGNYSAGVTTNTATVVGLSASGQVCVYTSAQTDLVVDVTGAMVPGSAFASAAPRRMLETRVGAIYTTADGQFQGIGARTAGQVTQLQILGRPGVDARTKSITATIAIINPLAGGYATVYPCNATPPTASNINFTAGVTIANTATSALSSSGAVCIFTSASADLIIDITGAQLTP
jgi:alpha-tubulin suppressor-like RCC1 family protein